MPVPERGVRWAVIAAAMMTSAICSTRVKVGAQQGQWADQDIGNPAIAGSASGTGTSFTIVAGGKDIWGTSDQFHFVYQQVTGDVDVRARVDSVANASTWSKAGVMIRGALAPNAANGFSLVSAGKGTAFQRRTLSGGSSTRTSGPMAGAPYWVRLVRRGTSVSSFTSVDGTAWMLIGTDTIQLPAAAFVGIAVTSRTASAVTTAVVSQVSVTPLGLPAGQQDGDVGSPAIAGSATYSGGTYQIQAGGADIGSTSDQFHYVYQQVTGDVDVSVRVASLSAADASAKAGIMIRETLDPASSHAFAAVSKANGVAFLRRPSAGGMTVSTQGTPAAAPQWVRVTRSGSLFVGYQSSDGQTWTTVAADTIPMVSTVYVGIAATSHSTTSAADVVADTLAITTTPTANQPPTSSISSPANGATFTAPASIAINATAADPEGQLTKVEFYNGTTLLGTATTAPYSFMWSSVPAGAYSLTAIAYDAGGLSTRSGAVSITVNAPPVNQPPTVSITSPASGATFTAPASIAITASASDPENELTKVELYNGAVLLGTDTAAPYSFVWSPVPQGTYSLTAVAYDIGGLNTRSAVVQVVVDPPPVTPPTGVIFTASPDHAAVASYRLDVFAAGADPATAVPVATMDAGKPVPDANNEITVLAPAFFSALAPGSYQLTVSAVNAAGIGRSAPIAFTR